VGFTLNRHDLPDLATGAAFLGTGGGGDPYVGRLMVEQALRDGGQVEIVGLDELGDGDFVIPTAMMGAPTCLVEKIPRGDETAKSLQALEAFLDKRATATMPIEAGGMNSTMPLVVGARLGLPVVDADGMGRAFPNLYQETFHVYGVSGTPMALTNEYGDTTIITTHDNFMMEWIARGITIRMGGCAYIAEYSMDGATAKRTSIAGTLGLCLKIGRAIRESRERHLDPFDRIIGTLSETPYQYGRVIWTGKIIEVFRRTTEGFAKGHVRIADLNGGNRALEIDIQNENLIAKVDDRVLAVVPDLICIMDIETAEPITTEYLRYGQRVAVMAVSTPPIMRTPEALTVFGPRAFGIDADFVPVETLDQVL
jgi:DUF917 family protein